MRKIHQILPCLMLVIAAVMAKAQPFVHPGLLQGKADLERIKTAISNKEEPVYTAFVEFQEHPQSQDNYQMKGPMAMVGRNPTVGQSVYDADANAAYQNALMWALTGKADYALKAREIINAWSSTLKSITGRDAVLMAGLGPFKMVNAAELLLYTNANWPIAEVELTKRHFKGVIYPVIKDFAPFANGNWDSAAMKTMMAIAVFCDDRAMFERALNYYVDGAGDGRLTNYIINQDGECQESGRDQGHTQLGIAHLGDCAEMAWNQGLNLYAYADNRLLQGFEYTAKYNLGMDVPYIAELDKTGKYLHKEISAESRGKLRSVYEQIYNHYVKRMGLKAPYTGQAAARIRPEPQGGPGADHIGFGTLLYTRAEGSGVDVRNKPAAPAGLLIKTDPKGRNALTWIEPAGATGYFVKRAIKQGGPYITISAKIKGGHYIDSKTIGGKLYFYTVCAVNSNGKSKDAYPAGVISALPTGWHQPAVGAENSFGNGQFDDKQLTIESAGTGVDSSADYYHFVYKALDGNGTISAGYVPQVSSQFSSFGLVIRNGTGKNSPEVMLMVAPLSSGQVEAPKWCIKLLSRNAGDVVQSSPTLLPLTDPIVTFSRLTGDFYFRLTRKGDEFTGAYSTDNKSWINIDSITLHLNKAATAGLFAASGVQGIATRVKFNEVNIN
ncbi:alginate lyase family protein [Mucilaginibacter gossypiicola]|nr:alginate lyase family protein [Mucilaginibacter gossypiicola]